MKTKHQMCNAHFSQQLYIFAVVIVLLTYTELKIYLEKYNIFQINNKK